MKHTKRFLSILVVLLLIFTMSPGVMAEIYNATAQGNNGPIEIEVVIEDGHITAVTVLSHSETAGISDPAIERIPAAIVEEQTLAVDTVSGATNTSVAILSAVEDAAVSAGLDIEALKTPVLKGEGQVIEREVDILVIGAGGSGMSAAIALKAQGEDVLLIEKAAQPGGATSLTGALTAGGMSQLQADRGASDDVDTIFMDMMRYGDYENDARMTRLFAENMGESADWLHEYVGVEFEESLSFFPEHTNDRALYPKGKQAGYLTSVLAARYADIGGELLTDTCAKSLIFEDGRVQGAECTTVSGDTLVIHAKATLLATGGYGASEALRPEKLESVLFYGSATSTGDGILMAQEVGAMTHYLDYLKCYPQGIEKPLEGGNVENGVYKANAYISPLASQAATLNDGAIYVNLAGERCMNENMDFVSIKKKTMAQDGIEVFLLLNQKGFDNWMDSMEVSSPLSREIVSEWLNNDASERPIFRTGSTLEEVAQRSGVDVQGLVATVEHFNQMVANGVDEDFGRTEMSVALEADGAWYLIEQRLRMATSLGGLKTSTTFEVFDESEIPIPGLWASGEVIGGVHGTESMPSCCVGWAVTSGRLAAQAISESLR